MHNANMFVRRLFAWPLIILGAIFTQIGGALLIAGSWIVDLDWRAAMEGDD